MRLSATTDVQLCQSHDTLCFKSQACASQLMPAACVMSACHRVDALSFLSLQLLPALGKACWQKEGPSSCPGVCHLVSIPTCRSAGNSCREEGLPHNQDVLGEVAGMHIEARSRCHFCSHGILCVPYLCSTTKLLVLVSSLSACALASADGLTGCPTVQGSAIDQQLTVHRYT